MTSHSPLPILFTVFGACVLSALADYDSCQCISKPVGTGGRKCNDGTKPSNEDEDKRYLPHNLRGLFGCCLPEVEANTMKCYRWSTKACFIGPDICEFSERTGHWFKKYKHLIATDQSATLQSPRYEELVNETKQTFGHKYFCVYNVSLNCPRSVVVIRPTSTTNWPKGPNPDCQNYVSFSTNRNSSIITHQFCGQSNYRAVLESDSFLGVLWTNKNKSDGVFEFRATCGPTPATDEEGSGGEDQETNSPLN